ARRIHAPRPRRAPESPRRRDVQPRARARSDHARAARGADRIAIGFFLHGVLGATVVALAFVLPSFFMVVALAWTYVQYGGLPWMQALFYGIGAVVIAIVAVAAYRLARGTNKRDPLLWAVFVGVLVATVSAPA